jgi:hypothetical protein
MNLKRDMTPFTLDLLKAIVQKSHRFSEREERERNLYSVKDFFQDSG